MRASFLVLQVPLTQKMRDANQSSNAEIVSAVQRRDPGKGNNEDKNDDDDGDDSDPMSEDDSDDGGNASGTVAGVPLAAAADMGGSTKAGTSAHKFMPPIEVELQMQQLWSREASTLDLIFASGKRQRQREGETTMTSPPAAYGGGDETPAAVAGGGIADGYRVFFVRALAVPPPRFRPPMNMGDIIAEHPQNVYLSKVGHEPAVSHLSSDGVLAQDGICLISLKAMDVVGEASGIFAVDHGARVVLCSPQGVYYFCLIEHGHRLRPLSYAVLHSMPSISFV